ncbi:alanine:cation symporter family protein [Acinetobacter sp. B5B]|uniref:alanine/glycine:cation symporter family protein n=1 Tax=Acinetobacter baretiae TaxID=2605383 RepID=UPI0018C2DD7F|nr:alanine/glycine:cation symporter family protein [Acinetobacter baretiae]MBF7683489.1 alanine:cation symporter family protein [Acinetobacter baretiae]MBF7684795.1 alanine:cation symporter family protein [Acinetobacter baretiae]
MNQELNNLLMGWITHLNDPLWDFLVIFLLAVGIIYTLVTGGVQLRMFFESIRVMKSSRQPQQEHGLTAFQAFVTGLASRVGVGNIGGVAIAIAIGGPGAVFWMWVTAIVGMSSAFVESSLAQLFKIRDANNQRFRGGPAYYITLGLKSKTFGVVFALSLILAYGFVFNSVQANAMASASSHAWGWDQYQLHVPVIGVSLSWVGLALVALTGLAIFGGIHRIAKLAEVFVPVKAGLYLAVTLYIIVMNLDQVPHIFGLIFTKAFQFDAAAGGFFGSMVSMALMQGVKRGLFSNEAGMGSAPNAAAASDVSHPVNQGLVQMLGVFVDTFVICTCTAMIILISGAYTETGYVGVELTQRALERQIGPWGGDLLAILLFLFCYSSILGNYAYAESNVQFIKNSPKVMFVFRILVMFMVYFGTVTSVPLVWNMADLSMGIMATLNLAAILLLMPFLLIILKDYRKQQKAGIKDPVFKLDDHPELKKKINTDIW